MRFALTIGCDMGRRRFARTIDEEDAVYVVGHDHENIYGYVGAHWGGSQSFAGGNFPGVVQKHLPVRNLAEQTGPVMRADGDKISPGPGIIVAGQPDRAAVVDVRVVWHVDSGGVGSYALREFNFF